MKMKSWLSLAKLVVVAVLVILITQEPDAAMQNTWIEILKAVLLI